VPQKEFMNTSTRSDRGCILQERVLSRRVLHWSAYEVSWECNEFMASERQPAGLAENEPYYKWSQRFKPEAPWRRFRALCYKHPDFAGEEDLPREMNPMEWHDMVREFSRRELTFVADR
jgi:hypothetical protein